MGLIRKLAYAAGGVALAVYVNDCWHVWKVYSEEMSYCESVVPTIEEEEEILKKYNGKSEDGGEYSAENTVDIKKYKEQISYLIEHKEEMMSRELEGPYRISRESVNFISGGRATLMQTAHPYIAAGIAQHSNLKNGVQQRFYNTFKHVFAMAFGDIEAVLSSSKEVRQLHSKVRGKVMEDVGIFKENHEFSANNLHALWWVQLTLIESAIFMFELFIRRLSDEEKEEHLKSAQYMAKAFGIPSEMLNKTWQQVRREKAVMLNSSQTVLKVSKNARMIESFLFKAPVESLECKLVMRHVRWSTAVLLPPRLCEEYYGRRVSKFEVFIWVLLQAQGRFIYRLLPHSFRWLTAYMDLRIRNGEKLSPFTMLCSSLSRNIANWGLTVLMPERDPHTMKIVV